jgi:CRISPR-associated protein Cas5d
MKNQIEFKVYGRYALFSDPLTKMGGEKCSYQIPTYEALKGIAKSIYWKPTFVWYVDRARVMRPIQTQSKSVKPLVFSGGNDLSIYTYLAEVEYQVQAHFEWNLNYPEMENDRIEGKHYAVAKRMVERGGRRDIFLGTRECQAYVEPCSFGEGFGAYDSIEAVDYYLMFHGFDYPDETGKEELWTRFWKPTMRKGIVDFIRPEDCTIRKFVHAQKMNRPLSLGLAEEGFADELDPETV